MRTWADIEPATPGELLAWAGAQAWARAMAACGQDAGWHAEGDVWTHTKMVAAELERLAEWEAFTREEQIKLLIVALFHDSGKPATTVLDPATGRTRSPKHAQVGAELARAALRDLGCPLRFREDVARLVRYHGRPPYLLEKPDPAREVIGLSWLLDHRLLLAFALADTRGRRTADTGRAEDDLHLWKLAAEEAGCWGRPYPFANSHARFLFYRDGLSSLDYAPREAYRCTVTLMAGLPGAGKDTWLQANRPALPVVSLDDLRGELDVAPTDDQGAVIQAAKERCREHLRAGRDFAFNATNTVKATRGRWVGLFAEYGARVEVVYVEPPLELIARRNADRSSSARVPRKVIDRLASRLEPPTLTEAHAVEWVG